MTPYKIAKKNLILVIKCVQNKALVKCYPLKCSIVDSCTSNVLRWSFLRPLDKVFVCRNISPDFGDHNLEQDFGVNWGISETLLLLNQNIKLVRKTHCTTITNTTTTIITTTTTTITTTTVITPNLPRFLSFLI